MVKTWGEKVYCGGDILVLAIINLRCHYFSSKYRWLIDKLGTPRRTKKVSLEDDLKLTFLLKDTYFLKQFDFLFKEKQIT